MEAILPESEAALREELAEERKRLEDFRREETLQTMRIVADKELEIIQQVEICEDCLAPTPTLILHPG